MSVRRLEPFEYIFPLLSSTKLQRHIRVNNLASVYDLIPHLGQPDSDRYTARALVEFARIDRESYIKANDILDRIVAERPQYLKTFMGYLETEIANQLHPYDNADGAWARSTKRSAHHLLDLWCDGLRRQLLAKLNYSDRVWDPTVMCVEITQQCNALCGHCASNSSPYTKIRLAPEKVQELVEQAALEGVEFLGLTGGEPFLEQKTLLTAIDTATQNGILFDYINSNCFWAKTLEQAIEVLSRVKAVANQNHIKQKRGMFSLSVTTEHLKWIPLQNFINVILAHEEVFPGQTIELVSVRGAMFGQEQAPVFEDIIQRLGDHVVKVDRDANGKVARIYTKRSEIDVFFNYIVPIGRGEDMAYGDYEHYELSDKELKRGLSLLAVDDKAVQTITVGWDGKCAPDVVLKCSESVIAGNLYLNSFAEVVANGNNDPLIRGILASVYRIINISKRTGIFDMVSAKLKYHNTIQGYVSEFMKDPKKRLLMTIDLLKEDLESGQRVFDEHGEPMVDADALIRDIAGPDSGRLLNAAYQIVQNFQYQYNFSGTAIRIHSAQKVVGQRTEAAAAS